jgi:hypothetical protein
VKRGAAQPPEELVHLCLYAVEQRYLFFKGTKTSKENIEVFNGRVGK